MKINPNDRKRFEEVHDQGAKTWGGKWLFVNMAAADILDKYGERDVYRALVSDVVFAVLRALEPIDQGETK